MAQSSLKNYFGLLSFLISVLVSFSASGAVRLDNVFIYGTSIPTTDINAKALLQMDSTTQGFLPPRLSGTQRDAITSVPEALAIYNSSTHYLNFWNGSAWKQPVTSGDIVNADIASGAAIAYAKLNLTGDIVDTDISSSAAISRGKIATGTPLSVVINGSFGELGSTTVLGVGFGGTNNAALATTAGGMLYTDGSKFVNMGAGSAGQVPVSTGAGAPIWGTTVGGNFANLIVGDFSNSGAGWTSSGGTFTTVTSGGNFMGVGTANGTWDSSAAAQTLTSPAYTISSGYAGTNGLWRCKVQNPTAATITMGRWDGTTLTDAIAIDPGTTAKYVEIADSFGAAATTTAIRFTSVASNEPLISIADCYIGLNFNLSSVNAITSNVSAGTITIGGTTTAPTFGTTTSNNVSYHREGQYAVITYNLVMTGAGTAGSGDYLVSLPAGLSVDTTIIPVYTASVGGNLQQVPAAMPSQLATSGTMTIGLNSTATVNDIQAYLYSSNQFRTSNISDSTVGLASGAFSSSYFALSNTSLAFNLTIKVPIAGWTATNAVRADNSNFGWTSYTPTFAGVGTATNISAQYKRLGDSMHIRASWQNGTTAASTATMSLPGSYTISSIVGTLQQVGFGSQSTTASGPVVVLGTGGGSVFNFSQNSTTSIAPFTAQNGSGIWNTSSTVSVYIIAPITGWSENQSAPMLVGTVFSNTGGQERVERATITGSATTPTVASQSGSWISSVTRNSLGNYTLNIAAGMFSSTPSCTCICVNLSSGTSICQSLAATTSTSFNAVCTNGTSGLDDIREIICMGPR